MRLSQGHYFCALLAGDAELEELARQLTKSHPGAAGSYEKASPRPSPSSASVFRPPWPAPYASTNPVESMIEICRDHSTNVKRWRDGQMALRWCAAGLSEAGKQFRKVNGFLHLPVLRRALERSRQDNRHTARVRSRSGLKATGPSPKFHESRDILSAPPPACHPGGIIDSTNLSVKGRQLHFTNVWPGHGSWQLGTSPGGSRRQLPFRCSAS